jgi:putative transposase
VNGTTLKWLSIVDEFTRECLALKVDRSITSEDVINKLAELFAMRGVPQAIRSDNGPEFVAQTIQEWLQKLKIRTLYVAPGSPWENGYAESFHSKLRDEFLGQEEFEARWGTSPRRSSRPVVRLPLRSSLRRRLSLLLRSSRTTALPNPYSHSPRCRNWGQVTAQPRKASNMPFGLRMTNESASQ